MLGPAAPAPLLSSGLQAAPFALRRAAGLLALLPLAAALSAGCNGDKAEPKDDDAQGGDGADGAADGADGAVITADLALVLATDRAVAGEPVPYTLVLSRSDGSAVDFDDLPLSDAGEVRPAPDGGLVVTAAAAHTLTATVDYEGETYTASAALFVEPGPVSSVDLALSDLAFPAGGGVDWTLVAADAYGNAIDTGALRPSADRAGLSVGDGALSGTSPGAYTLTAELDGLVDTEVVVILSGAPAAVALSLSDEHPELFETTTAAVAVTDAFGNPVPAPWTLSLSGPTYAPGDAALSYRNITFYEEGAYTVRVDVDGTGLSDELGPIYVDSTGPDLTITSPARGGWNNGLSGTVRGTVEDELSGVGALTVNGAAVSPAADGSFSRAQTYVPGVNIVETTATDGDGNVTIDTRAVLAGTFVPWGTGVSDGFLVRIHEGVGGFDTLEDAGEGLINATDITALIPNPVLTRSSTSCTLGVCVTWYSVTLRVRNPTIGATSLDLDPRTGGVLRGIMLVDDIAMEWTASGKLAGVNYSGSGDITADRLRVVVDMLPSVNSAHNIVAPVSSVAATATNFDFDMSGTLYDVLNFFGLASTISSTIEGYVLSAIEDAVAAQVPGLVEDNLQDLALSIPLPVGGRTYVVNAVPDSIVVDSTGLSLGLETTVVPDRWTKGSGALGSLAFGDAVSTWDRSRGTWLGINLDFFNQALMAFWGGGLLDMQLSGAALGLDAADLSALLPGLTELNIGLEALLPPVAVPVGAGVEGELQLGDMRLTLYNGPAVAGNEMIQVYFSAFIDMDTVPNADATALEIVLGDMDLRFDVVIPDSGTVGARDTEALLELLVPLLLPTLTDALSEIPIPDISGYGLGSVTVDTLGAQDAYIGLGGNLVAR